MTELEILPEMPNSNIQFNTLYSPVLQHSSDENVLTEIKREDISVGKLLGSGAFGEVNTNFFDELLYIINIQIYKK